MDGLYSVFVDEKKHQLRPGQAILLAAGQPHLAQTVRDGEQIYLSYSGKVIFHTMVISLRARRFKHCFYAIH